MDTISEGKDRIEYNAEIGEWEVYLDNQVEYWAQDRAQAKQTLLEALRVRREHNRVPSDVPYLVNYYLVGGTEVQLCRDCAAEDDRAEYYGPGYGLGCCAECGEDDGNYDYTRQEVACYPSYR